MTLRCTTQPPSRSREASPLRPCLVGRAHTGSRSSAARSRSAAKDARSSRTRASSSTPHGQLVATLSQDPPLRRRGRRCRLQRVRGGGAGRRTGRRRRRRLEDRAVDLLRRPLPRALPNPHARGCSARDGARALHDADRQGSLAAFCYARARSRTSSTSPLRPRSARRFRASPRYGRSLIADPWGLVVAQAPDEETVITAELDRTHLENIRAKLPSLANRQPNAYRWPTPV